MATTPPPPTTRARTPPTPLHGPQYDNYEPYSPRRSKRSTAHSNPYSSFNGERSPKNHVQHNTTPPPTVRKARFARQPTQLSSPPSSPAPPARLRRSPQQHIHKTPRKQVFHHRGKTVNGGGAQSDSDGPSTSLAPPTIDPVTMLPTPSKTPKKRQAAAISSTARILSFQPDRPNDVMPSPRRMKKHARSLHSMAGFDLYDDEAEASRGDQIEIYTDANARVPEVDESADNPFVGRKKSAGPRPQRRSRKSAEEMEREQRIEEAVQRDEGVTYVFRGKKVFRRFTDQANNDNSNASGSDVSATPEQRRLKRQAGPAAQRPLTRSAIKPRLLFPSEEQRLQREGVDDDDVDEEAITDIEMENAQTFAEEEQAEDVATPVTTRFTDTIATPPPTTNRATTRSAGKKAATPMPDDEPEPMSVGTDGSLADRMRRRNMKSPFDAWQRTKSGRKRAGEAVEEAIGGGKRTRGSTVVGSPA
ncbi:hypothetical protein LTR37_013301 [Vermiconidia calcicola]|uniref:Uncharacterized protein n=1 Tax=Vermiconidia calcicola TaxID=1690605 RepID=A0ACC3MYB9_9PEZI|nr:hypothetical protein LTR37_013301 [Vermiconidia calcicola]